MRVWRWLRWTLLGLAGCAALLVGLARWKIGQSLPQTSGTVTATGLAAKATVARDAAGRPVITAASRTDLAYALGYAHGQDRFFQMDLSRRFAAGELSELFGAVAVEQDTETRRFGFRAVARRVLQATPPGERAIMEAYAKGVNAGRDGLAARPWEYLLLRAEPSDWAPEDSVLVVHSMWWQLQHGTVLAELDRRRLERAAARRASPEAAHALIAFAWAGHGDWDTPNYAAEGSCMRAGCQDTARVLTHPFPELLRFLPAPPVDGETQEPRGEPKAGEAGSTEPRAPGSNGWAVSGLHTKSGVAMVANDMHLDIGVPAIWYPARLVVQLPPVAAEGSRPLDVAGVTLPGTPALVAGSNGRIAWGFTNSYGDFSDVRFAPCASPDYRVRAEHIAVKGGAPVTVEYREAGPAVVLDGEAYADDVANGECAQVAWLATRPEATNFELLALENATTIDEALALAPTIGIPGQNAVIGDVGGRIAWTLFGRVPRGAGPDRLFGAMEFRDGTDHPRISDPPVGRLWTANQRIVDGPLELVMGDDEVDVGAGGYDLGARARQIRDGLVGLSRPATEADMLAIQLDSRALFIARWRNLLLALLDEESMRDSPARREFRAQLSDWQPTASPDAVGYRLVREFRGEVLDTLWNSLVAGLLGPGVEMRRPASFEAAAWRLVSERPSMIAPPREEGVDASADWRAFLLARLDAASADLLERCGALKDCRFGARRPVKIRHPLSRALPILSGWLDMPVRELAGDHHMPRVQDGMFGASERFAVSPGREDQGYLELPGGPSGHPLSPHYRSGFDDWAEGRPTPFLPGPAVDVLDLFP
jgi:penicillin G amidase